MEANTATKVDYTFISKIKNITSNWLWMKIVLALVLLVPNTWMKKTSKPKLDK